MKILIVEDEELAQKKLVNTLQAVEPDANVVGITDGIQATVDWLAQHGQPDLILMDIELCDGQSFEIFQKVQVKTPVVFTTSYDEFALKAFKVNSVDYLLKPIQKDDLKNALKKYKELRAGEPAANIETLVSQLRQQLQPKEYRKRFLVKHGQRLVSVDVEDIRYFFSEGRLNFFKTEDNKKFVVDYTMDELEDMLDPAMFFRTSRSFYVAVNAIDRIDDYFGNRLILQLNPPIDKEALVSREKVSEFKKWMGK